MTSSPMHDLTEVDAWLGSLGDSVKLSAALFSAPAVTSVFEMLPEPIAVTVTGSRSSDHTLEGTAEFLGEAETKVKLSFAEAGAPAALTCELVLTPPANFAWQPLATVDLTLERFSGTFSSDPSLALAGLDLTATVKAGATDPLELPLEISVPNFEGDWHVRGEFKPAIKPNADGLAALAGGSQEARDLVQKIGKAIQHFELTAAETAFDPFAPDAGSACSLIGLSVAYTEEWKFFDEHFALDQITFAFTAIEPFSGAPTLQAKLGAEIEIGGTKFDVGGSYPDMAVFARLAPQGAINVKAALESLHVKPPTDFPDIKVGLLSFVFYVENHAFELELGVEEPFTVLDVVQVDQFTFALRNTYNPSKNEFAASGNVYCQIEIGNTTVALGGSYSSAGLALEGSTRDLKLEEITTHLREKFQIGSVPKPIEKLALKTAHAGFDTAHGKFSFVCEGSTEVAGVEVDFMPKIEAEHQPAADGGKATYTGKFGGWICFTPKNADQLNFEVEFSKTESDEQILATYWDPGQDGLSLNSLLKAIGFDEVSLPDALQLTLNEVTLLYDFTEGNEFLAIGASTKQYGRAAFVALPLQGRWQFFFVFAASADFSLSNLPLVGKELSQVEELSVTDLAGIVAGEAPEKKTAETVNAAIEELNKALSKVGGKPLPLLPLEGSGKLNLAATVQAGQKMTPLDLSLGGGSTVSALPAATPTAPPSGEEPGTTKWIDVQKSFGPVSVQRIGAMYQAKTETVWFELDADLLFGPLTLSLEGLGVGSPLKDFSPSFDLRGLGVAYKEPPLEIAGGLVNLAPPGASYVEFEGGVVVAAEKWKLQALGFYGDKPGYPSMFLFGALEYPLGGPPAFFVTGLALGFGYNSELRIPTIEEVGEFPLVATLPGSTMAGTKIFGPNPTPLDVLEYMRQPHTVGTKTQPPWVEESHGSLWFGAGVTFTSFELVTGQALVVVETGQELTISLIGTAGTEFPQADERTSGQVYARVELDILVRLAPSEGVFSAQAQLAKGSFVLDRSCALTGGFAFFVWFGSSPYAGDFVFTLGGYNRAYVPPPYYPTVPEVGFNWSVDDSITLSGGVYLAITPAVLMAGARLNATYSAGNLNAWFNAHADILIRWKPFWVQASIGISVGASYTIDLLFCSWTPTVELSCELEVWGPPTGGKVHVDWYVIGFTIHFGSGGDEPAPLTEWSQVEKLLPSASPPGAGEPTVLSLKPSAGLMPPPGGKAEPGEGPWAVRSGHFAFEATSPIPVTTATVGSQPLPGGAESFDVHPLGALGNGAKSTYRLTVTEVGGQETDFTSKFTPTALTHDLPASLWGSPPEGEDGSPQVPAATEQLVKDQMIGASLEVEAPTLGTSGGPIEAAKALANRPLGCLGAKLPVSATETPSGDVPAVGGGDGTVAKIASPSEGIASQEVSKARDASYRALLGSGLVAPGCEAEMTEFRKAAVGAFAAEPLLVS
ncbi:MAG: DUF6603 domain-containing protein [Solirubrobacterales bacterium]